IVALLFVFCLAVSSVSALETNDLIGHWQGVDYRGKKVSFIFYKEGYLKIVSGKQIIGGEKNESLKYQIITGGKPEKLDLVMSKNGKEEKIQLIAKMIDSYRMILYGKGKGKERPAKFYFKDSKNLMIVFKEK
ncbi:MAG: hypothetical protein AAF518_02970, partial [Spirochaetota bacterium]